MSWCSNKKKIHKDKRNEPEDYCTFSFDIVQKEHEYESLKCEPSGSKLGSILQSLQETLENLLTKETCFTQGLIYVYPPLILAVSGLPQVKKKLFIFQPCKLKIL